MTQLRIGGEPPAEILLFTSKLIFVPALIALFLRRWADVFIISFQAASAIWFHSSHTPVAFYADQLGTLVLATHTLLLARSTPYTPPLFVIGFGYMLVVYSYGQRNKCFCFDPNPRIADRFHASIHLLGITIYSSSMIFFLPYEAAGILDVNLIPRLL